MGSFTAFTENQLQLTEGASYRTFARWQRYLLCACNSNNVGVAVFTVLQRDSLQENFIYVNVYV